MKQFGCASNANQGRWYVELEEQWDKESSDPPEFELIIHPKDSEEFRFPPVAAVGKDLADLIKALQEVKKGLTQ